jgi:phospholipase C
LVEQRRLVGGAFRDLPVRRRACGTRTPRRGRRGFGFRRRQRAVRGRSTRSWAELAGSADGVAAGLDVRLRISRGSLSLELANHSSKPLTVKLKSLGYGTRTIKQDLRGKQTRSLTWPTDRGWYDVEITTPEDPTYRRRLTGHLESGRPSITG